MSESVVFQRGGVEVTLFKAPDKFSVKLKSGETLSRMPQQLLSKHTGALGVRFLKRFPGQSSAIFWSPSDRRDEVMELFRQEEEVQYCSHVYARSDRHESPLDEIGLDDKIYAEVNDPENDIAYCEAEFGLRAVWRFPEFDAGVIFELTTDARQNPLKISRELLKTGRCGIAEPCLIDAKNQRMIPNDPGFRAQWHLLNTGQGGGVPGADCNATGAWDYTWGDPNIVVAVIDDGFDLLHPDFSTPGKIYDPYDASQRDTDPSPTDMVENHGTSCAGVAVAARGGGLTVGVAPDCGLMPIRHAGRLGDFEEALAFYHAYIKQADIISCSWGPQDAYIDQFWPMPSLTQRIVTICTTHGRNGLGIPIFFAAGNGNESLEFDGYANHDQVIAVAASTNEDQKAYYSDYGQNVWVTAPSNGGTLGITTTDRMGYNGYNQMSDYTYSFGGTSSATPLVAGIAALMLSVNPDLTLEDVKAILRDTAVKINEGYSTTRRDVWGNDYDDSYDADGHSLVYGWGRVDAGAAVRAAIDMLPASD